MEKAEVFHRVIGPEFSSVVTITDKDLKTALNFMISLATIVEEMTREIISNPYEKVNYKKYQRKIRKYQPTLEGMLEEFEDSVFGSQYNRRNREHFIEILATEGWKYFQIKDLNQLFSIMLERHGVVEVTESEEEEEQEA